jgi:hypothetical protein
MRGHEIAASRAGSIVFVGDQILENQRRAGG